MLEEGKGLAEIIRTRGFRQSLMSMVEGYLKLAGYTETIAIMGHKFSFNLKSSKNTYCIFEIGLSPIKFHLVMYELAYINIACMNLITDQVF